MNRNEVIDVLQKVLATIQHNSGRLVNPVNENTSPIGDLDGFDSLNGVEATVELADKLGIEIDGVSVFVNEAGTKALTVGEIATLVLGTLAKKETKS